MLSRSTQPILPDREPRDGPTADVVAPQISVCMLAGHGTEHLRRALAGLLAQEAPPPFELLVGGNPGPASRAAIAEAFPTAQICDTGSRFPGAARNPLVERARGELLLFLDDDVIPRSDLLRRLVAVAADHPEASVFGGPNETPPGSSAFQIVQGAVLSSILGAGPVSRRYGARHACYADERWFTLCNMAIRRPAMLPFVDELVCAEENALLTQLGARGELMRYEPDLRVYHARRGDLVSFGRQMLKYGRGRGQLLAREPRSLRLVYLAPTFLLAYLLLLAPALLLGDLPRLVAAPAVLYAGLLLATAVRIATVLRRASAAGTALALLFTVHVLYGLGVLRGLLMPARQPSGKTRPVWWPAAQEGGSPSQ